MAVGLAPLAPERRPPFRVDGGAEVAVVMLLPLASRWAVSVRSRGAGTAASVKTGGATPQWLAAMLGQRALTRTERNYPSGELAIGSLLSYLVDGGVQRS